MKPVSQQYRFNQQDVKIETPDGVRLSGLVFSPHEKDVSPERIAVFVHGFAGNKSENGLFTDAAVELIKHKYHVITYDWRGCGQSEGDFGTTSIEKHVEDFLAVWKWLQGQFKDVQQIDAVGFSLGAAILTLAYKNKVPIRRLVFLSPALRPAIDMWPRYQELYEDVELTGYVQKPGSSIVLGEAILDSLRVTDLLEETGSLNMPILVCHGTNDDRIPIQHTRDLVNHLPNADFQVFDGASHSYNPADKYREQVLHSIQNWFCVTEPAQDPEMTPAI